MRNLPLELVVTLIALYCTRHSRAPNIDRCTPESPQTDGRTDGRYKVHYIPRLAVDNKWSMTDCLPIVYKISICTGRVKAEVSPDISPICITGTHASNLI